MQKATQKDMNAFIPARKVFLVEVAILSTWRQLSLMVSPMSDWLGWVLEAGLHEGPVLGHKARKGISN